MNELEVKNWVWAVIIVGIAAFYLGMQHQRYRVDCMIKGNITEEDRYVYHLPGGLFYEETQIDESRGEEWFCTEDQAQNDGWVRSEL